VEPTRFVVLAVGVVIAALRAPHFVAHGYHGHTQGERRHGQEVLHLAIPQLLDGGVLGRAFRAAIPALVIIGAVAIVFAVCLIVFVVVGDEVVERETIVTRHEVDTLLRLALLVPVDLGAADNAVRDAAQRSWFAAEEIAEVVATAALTLLPASASASAILVEPVR